jgi:MFS family permease
VHGLGSADIGLYFGAVYGVLGLCGTLTSGFVADYLGRTHESRKLLFPAVTALLTCPAYLLFLLADSVWLALIGLGLIGFLTNGLLGPIWAIMQSVSKIRMRSTAAALFQLMTNLIGMGIGPALIGYLNDMFAPRYGDISIRYSMLLLAAAALISGIALLSASFFVSRDVVRTAGSD